MHGRWSGTTRRIAPDGGLLLQCSRRHVQNRSALTEGAAIQNGETVQSRALGWQSPPSSCGPFALRRRGTGNRNRVLRQQLLVLADQVRTVNFHPAEANFLICLIESDIGGRCGERLPQQFQLELLALRSGQ